MKKRKLKREKAVRQALLKSLFQALVEREKISTTLAKARELRPFAEKLISKARENTIVGRRALSPYLTPRNLKKIFNVTGPAFKNRPGGYLRIIKTGFRRNDSAPRATIEFVK